MGHRGGSAAGSGRRSKAWAGAHTQEIWPAGARAGWLASMPTPTKGGRSPKRSARSPQARTLCNSCRQLVGDVRSQRELELTEFIKELRAQNEQQQALLLKLEEQLQLHKDYQAQVYEKQAEVQDLQEKNQKLALLLKKQTEIATKALYQSGRNGSPIPAQPEMAKKMHKETEAKMHVQIAQLRAQHAEQLKTRMEAEAALQLQIAELHEQHASHARTREEELHDEHEERRKEAVDVATATQVTLKQERDHAQTSVKLLEQKLQDIKLEQAQQERQREMEIVAGQTETQSALQSEAVLAVGLRQQVEELERQLQSARLAQAESEAAARDAEQMVLSAAEHLQSAARTVNRGTSPRSPMATLGTPAEAVPPQDLLHTPPSGDRRSPRSPIAPGSSLEERAEAEAERFSRAKTERLQEVHAMEIESIQMQLKLHAIEHDKLVHMATKSPLAEGSPLLEYVRNTSPGYGANSPVQADGEAAYAAAAQSAQDDATEVKSPDRIIGSPRRLESDTEHAPQQVESTRIHSPNTTVSGNRGARKALFLDPEPQPQPEFKSKPHPVPEPEPQSDVVNRGKNRSGSVASDTPDEQFGPASQRSRINSDQMALAQALAASGDLDTSGLVLLGAADKPGDDQTSGLQPLSRPVVAAGGHKATGTLPDDTGSTNRASQSARSNHNNDDVVIEKLLDDDRRSSPSPPSVPPRRGERSSKGKSASPRPSAGSDTLPADVVGFLDGNQLANYHALFANCPTLAHVYKFKNPAQVRTTAKKTKGFESMTAVQHEQVAQAVRAGIENQRRK